MTLLRTCEECNGSGRNYWSRYGGNDPDVVDKGPCINNCDHGHVAIYCEAWKCREPATEIIDGTPCCAAHAVEFREEADV